MAIAVFCLLAISTFSASAEEGTITVSDAAGDVINEAEEIVDRPDIDIEELSCEQSGQSVELTLKLASGGTIQNTGILGYTMAVITTNNEYAIAYSFQDEETLEFSCYGLYLIGDEEIEIPIKTCSGAGTDTLTVSFDLITSSEICVSIGAINYESLLDSYYMDEANLYTEPLLPIVNETFNATTGESLELGADIEGVEASDYDWIWTFEGINDILRGQDVTHIFNVPKVYEGTLYVFNETGVWGTAYFSVNVTGAPVNGDNGGKGSGNTLLMFGGLLLIIIIIGILVVVIVSRR